MRRFILAATAIAALAVPAVAASSAMAAGSTTCSGTMGGTISTNLTVPAGSTCKLEWAHVTGNVSVAGDLTAAQVVFDKNVDVNGGHFYGINGGFVVKGNMSIQNSPDVGGGNVGDGFWSEQPPYFQPNGSEIDGNFSYINSTAKFYVQGPTTVKGNFTYSGNRLAYGTGSGLLTVQGASSIS